MVLTTSQYTWYLALNETAVCIILDNLESIHVQKFSDKWHWRKKQRTL